MRRQQEGMGNLWKKGPAPEHEDSPWGESHGTDEKRGKGREVKGGAKHSSLNDGMYLSNEGLLWSNLVPLEAQDIDSYKAAWCLFSPLLFCSSGSAASLPA